MTKIRKVGRYTVALGLVALGAALLADNLFGAQSYTRLVLRLWPLLLVGVGAEYLAWSQWAQRHPDQEVQLRFDVGAAFLMALVVTFSAGLVTVGGWFSNPLHFSLGVGPTTQWSESRTVDTAGVTTLQLDVPVGSLRLEPADGADEVQVEASYAASGLPLGDASRETTAKGRLTVTADGPVISISAPAPETLTNYSVRLTVHVPQGLKVKAVTQAGFIAVEDYRGEMDLESKVGRVEVEDSAGSLTVNSGSGQVKIDNFEGPVVAHANVGSLEVAEVVGPVQVDSGTGSIRITDFRGGSLTAETRTGSIQAETDQPLEGDLSLKTQNGQITLSVPEESSMQVTAQTRAGSLNLPSFVSTTREGAANSGQGIIGDGRHRVTLQTGTGSISFHID